MLARRRVRGSKNGLGPWRSLEASVRFLEIQEGGGKRWGKPSTAEGLRDQPRRGGHVGTVGKEEEGLSLLRDREMGEKKKRKHKSMLTRCPKAISSKESPRSILLFYLAPRLHPPPTLALSFLCPSRNLSC